MKAKGKNQFRSNKKENQGSSSNFKSMDVEKLYMSRLTAQIQREVMKIRAESFSRKR